MSRCIRNSWTLDASVEWRGPFGEFRYQPNTVSSIKRFEKLEHSAERNYVFRKSLCVFSYNPDFRYTLFDDESVSRVSDT